ncbi:ATP-binding protein [Candidatus Viridilinea mediisalina]|uniref:Histidine kinase/HSP90-like ATPase domain-containing protein n=1 Tax=Candidatus Viridilinea mediisalina TaxID=2024553 RepID=A0A2A6RHE9_9CHLR|nr:ATP-binding protein [Candidatus Viridilinea mediisalina]PDW02371.1 hypothetical protein CJ255_14350 [Candidatus Viridilinea mediisalina]
MHKAIEKQFVLSTDPNICIEQLHLILEEFWCVAPVDCEQQLLFSTALCEVMTNILRYAVEPSGGEIVLRLRLTSCLLEARIADWGRPWVDPPSHYRLPDAMQEHGRGLAIAAKALDQLSYRRLGNLINCWRLRLHV